MMNTTTTPPEHIAAIFPIKGNETSITEAALKFGIIAYPQFNVVHFIGTLNDYHKLKQLLKGGVTAH